MKHAEVAQARSRFEGLKILVVEDESIVSFLLEDMLTDIGCNVLGHAASLDEAFTLFEKLRPQAAVLDVNLRGEMVYPFAERLERDRVPFLFATGYGVAGIPERWQRWPVIQKPFQLKTLVNALGEALTGERAADEPDPQRQSQMQGRSV
jgi:CheY-like chemotaxis protein